VQIRIKIPSAGTHQTLIDEIKGLAILAILINHAGGVLVWRNILHGDLGSDIFFLMSGIALAIGRNTEMAPLEFIKRRLVRIIPAYWLVLTVYLVLESWLLQRDLPTPNIIAHYFAVHSLFGDAYAFAVNDGFWFITAILGCYAFFLATRQLLERKPDWLLLISAVVSLTIISILSYYGQGGLMGHWGFRMADFCCGMFLGYALKKGELSLPLTPTLGLALLLYLYMPYTQSVVLYSTAVAVAVVAFYTFTVRKVAASTGARRTLAFLGKHSFEIFLIHQPLMREFNRYALARWFDVTDAGDGLLALGIVCSLGVTLLAAVELHRLTKALSAFLLRRRAPLLTESQAVSGTGFAHSVRGLYSSPQGQRLRRSLRPARRAGTAVGRLLSGRTQG